MGLKLFAVKHEAEHDRFDYYPANNIYGYKNDNGKVVIEAQYTNATEFVEGFALVQKYGSVYLLNEKNPKDAVQIFNVDNDANFVPFHNGIALISGGQYKGYKLAMIDKKGEFVTDYIFSNYNQVQISDLKTMVKLVQENGSNVLNWANPNLLASKSNQEYIKIALKNYLKANAGKYIANSNEVGFINLVEKEKETMQNIFNEKINSIIKENTTSCLYFGIVDEIIK